MRVMRYAIVVMLLCGMAVGVAIHPTSSQEGASNLGPVVNGKDSDFGPIITADGSALYFTSDRPGGSGGQDIYVSLRNGGDWGTPSNLGPGINTKYNEGPDTLSVDERSLFFTRCDKVGDPGTCDIYMAQYEEVSGQWVRPRNLGPNVNSNYNDANASVSHDEQTLYFVSDRPSEGAKKRNWDIFRTTRTSLGWSQAQRLGPPINTDEHEFHVMIHQNDRLLFFSSDGHGGFGDADIFVSSIESGLFGRPRNLGPMINTEKNDMYFTVSAALDVAYLASNRRDTHGLEDIYWVPFDIDLPDAGVVIVKGIVADRCTCAPPTKDLATGIDVYDITTCIPIEGAAVRLAEVMTDKLIKDIRTGPSGSFQVVIPSGSDFAISATAPGYSFHTERFNIDRSHPFEIVERNILLDTCGDTFIVRHIYFDFDSAVIRCDSKNELHNAIRWLQFNPGIRIEVGGHTDSAGSESYNLKLSRSRARAVKDYLVTVGNINPIRIEFRGYGERLPIGYEDCEDGPQINRRVEFKIVP